MIPTIRRRTIVHACFAMGASTLVPAARACEYFSSNLRITHPWTRATADGVEFAVVCMKFDEVTQTDHLIRVETPVASGAEMVGLDVDSDVNFPIPQGQETLLGETGVRLRLVGLRHPLEVARTYPLRLVFDKGGVVNATLNIDYASFRFK